MTIDDFLSDFRALQDDMVAKYLWSDAEFITYCNKRLNEFAIKTEYYRDSTTTAICSIAAADGTASYVLDERIISIKRAKGSWRTYPLKHRTIDYMDKNEPNWDIASEGSPECFLDEIKEGYLTLWPTPSSAGTVSLVVARLPLTQLKLTDIGASTKVSIEFPLLWIDNLMDGVRASAYGKHDAQCFNPEAEQYHLALWNNFIEEAKAYVQKKRDIRVDRDPETNYYGISI